MTEERGRQRAHLEDALERVLADPFCAVRWHRLWAAAQGAAEPAARRQVVDILAAMPKLAPRADALRFTFLAAATGDPAHLAAAAASVLAEPSDPHMLAAFMAYEWLGALAYQPGREAFVAALARARLPEMAARLAAHAAALLPAGLVPRVPGRVERVAVVAPYIGNLAHTPSRMAADQCRVLAGEGLRPALFSSQELVVADQALCRGDGGTVDLAPADCPGWSAALPAGVAMQVSNPEFNFARRWRNVLARVAEFDPDVVLLVGLYSPLAAALHRLRPVVGLSVNTVVPAAPLDVWLAAAADGAGADAWQAGFPAPEPWHYPYRLRRQQGPWQATRASLGLPEDAILWVTSGYRLAQEIGGDWAARMAASLRRHPDAVWLLVGGAGAVPPALRDAPTERLRVLAGRSDIAGVLGLCDIYVNPPRMGGGFSVAEAMAEGLPVVALAGSDGGDKVGGEALADAEGYFARLSALTGDAGLRAEAGARLRRRFAEFLDLDAAGPSLRGACERAAFLAGPRLTAAAS